MVSLFTFKWRAIKMKKLSLVLLLILFTVPVFAFDGVSNTIGSGRQTVTTAGTAVQLSTSDVPCTRVIITAFTNDTGVISIGDSGVLANTTTRKGIPLIAGQSVTVPINNLNKIYVDATVSTEGVSYTYFN